MKIVWIPDEYLIDDNAKEINDEKIWDAPKVDNWIRECLIPKALYWYNYQRQKKQWWKFRKIPNLKKFKTGLNVKKYLFTDYQTTPTHQASVELEYKNVSMFIQNLQLHYHARPWAVSTREDLVKLAGGTRKAVDSISDNRIAFWKMVTPDIGIYSYENLEEMKRKFINKISSVEQLLDHNPVHNGLINSLLEILIFCYHPESYFNMDTDSLEKLKNLLMPFKKRMEENLLVERMKDIFSVKLL